MSIACEPFDRGLAIIVYAYSMFTWVLGCMIYGFRQTICICHQKKKQFSDFKWNIKLLKVCKSFNKFTRPLMWSRA